MELRDILRRTHAAFGAALTSASSPDEAAAKCCEAFFGNSRRRHRIDVALVGTGRLRSDRGGKAFSRCLLLLRLRAVALLVVVSLSRNITLAPSQTQDSQLRRGIACDARLLGAAEDIGVVMAPGGGP